MSEGWLKIRLYAGVGSLVLLAGLGKAAAAVDHLRGSVTAVGAHSYEVRSDAGMIVRVVMAPAGRLYRLVPAPLSAARSGWGAHAIGSVRAGTIAATMLVLFPPGSAAGVPPPSARMSGVGILVRHRGSLRIRVPGGEKKIVLAPAARIVIARPALLGSLHRGDMAMAFGHRTPSGFVASIVHIPPHMPRRGIMGQAGGRMSGVMEPVPGVGLRQAVSPRPETPGFDHRPGPERRPGSALFPQPHAVLP